MSGAASPASENNQHTVIMTVLLLLLLLMMIIMATLDNSNSNTNKKVHPLCSSEKGRRVAANKNIKQLIKRFTRYIWGGVATLQLVGFVADSQYGAGPREKREIYKSVNT